MALPGGTAFQAMATQQAERAAKSNYEMFAATSGILHVTEFYDLPNVPLKYGHCACSLIRSKNTQSNDVALAMRIEFTDQDGYKHLAFLDEDEVVSLEAALKYILQNRDQLRRNAKTYTEVQYSSRGGFKAGLFVMVNREVGEFMHIGIESAFLRHLEELAAVVDEALFKIESFKEGSTA